jgi:hypothetical protein
VAKLLIFGATSDLWLYRERTALLKRYHISIELADCKVTAWAELFRSKVTSYRMSSFEDAVIFVHDVERAIEQLDQFAKEIVATVVFRTVHRMAAEVLLRPADHLPRVSRPSTGSATFSCGIAEPAPAPWKFLSRGESRFSSSV